MAEYNPDEARKVLEGSLEQRIIAYADLKCGKGAEVAAELRKGNYRENHEDPIQTLDKVCGKPEIIDAEFESIDGVVEYQPKPSMLKVALKGTGNLINKTRWYYPLVGALPGKYQQKIAQRRGENDARKYTIANGGLEAIASVSGFIATLITFTGTGYSSVILPVSLGLGSFVYFLYSVARIIDKETDGSPLTTIPFYLTLGTILAGKKVVGAVKDSYYSVYQNEEKRIEAEKNLRIEEQKRIEEQNTYLAEEQDAGMNPEEMPTARKYLHKE